MKEEKIHWRKALDLAKQGKDVPEHLIDYDDENIVYDEDCPPLTQEDIKKGHVLPVERTVVLSQENLQWLQKHTGSKSLSEQVNFILAHYRWLYENL